MKYAYCGYLLVHFVSAFYSTDIFEEELFKLTNEIVETYFNQFNCLTYITESKEPASQITFDKLILNIDINGDFNPFEILIETHEKDCENYIVRVKPENKDKMIHSLIDAYRNSANSYNRQRYLYLPYDENDNNIEILNMMEMFYTPNLIMITSIKLDDRFVFSVVDHNYFNGYRYDVLGIKHDFLDTWTFEKGFERKVDLYPDKIKNLHGKELIMATIHYPLFTLIINEGNETVYDGLETRIVAAYVEIHNGKWDVIDHPIHLWGTLFDNGTGDGILGSVISHKADMGYAAIYQWHCDVLACSYPYVYAEVTCMVPRPDLMPGWMTVILPFTPITWVVFIVFYFVSSCFVFFMSIIVQRMEDQKKPSSLLQLFFDAYYNSLRLQLQQIPTVAYTRSSLAVYLKYLAVYYFFVALCWSGGIAAILTIPRYEDPINTVDDLLERSPPLQWGGTSIDWILSIEQTSDPAMRRIVDEFVVGDQETLSKRITTGDFGFFMERLPNGHFGMDDYITEDSLKYLKMMEDYIYVGHVVIVLPKASPYQESLDKMIFRMFETGLMQKLEVQVSLDRIDDRLQNMIRSSNEKPAKKAISLKIRHIEGPLVIYVGGITFSILIFLAELCFYKFQIFLLKEKVKEIKWAYYTWYK